MTNYVNVWRSNYVGVRNIEAFKEAIPFDCLFVEQGGKVALMPPQMEWDSSGAPFDFLCITEDGEESFPVPWGEICRSHLLEGEVLIIQEIGWEGLRYLVGIAKAIAWNGEEELVDLNDIYPLSTESFVGCNSISLCTQ